jgi:acyl-CoA thioester hydrolase
MTDAPTAGRFEGRAHLLPVRVYYEDTDFTGLVYHGNYVRFFERGRSDFLRMAGVSHSDLLVGDSPSAFVVTRMEIDFRLPARIDDALLVNTTYDSAKGARLFITQTITRDGALIAQAVVEAACISLGGRPRKPPPGLVERLKPWFEAQTP